MVGRGVEPVADCGALRAPRLASETVLLLRMLTTWSGNGSELDCAGDWGVAAASASAEEVTVGSGWGRGLVGVLLLELWELRCDLSSSSATDCSVLVRLGECFLVRARNRISWLFTRSDSSFTFRFRGE